MASAPEELKLVVVAIDPAVSTNEHSDETGIVVAGLDRRNHAYILADYSGKYAPHEWARKALEAYDLHKADRIIAEANQGGQMVEHAPVVPAVPDHDAANRERKADDRVFPRTVRGASVDDRSRSQARGRGHRR
jgi:phage terminase large subunit-like protein